MPTWPPSPLPIDLLNVLFSFIGDKFHYLMCDSLTPQGRLSQARFYMQSRTNRLKRSRRFCYCTPQVLHVIFCDEVVHEEPPSYPTRLARLKAWRDMSSHAPVTRIHLDNQIRGELAKKYAKNIRAMRIRSNLTP